LRESLEKPVILTAQDNFRFHFRPAQVRYLFIYIADPNEDYIALQPESDFNPLHPLTTTLLPAPSDWFYLSGAHGIYRLFLVTATSELSELDDRYNQYLQHIADPEAESARSNLSEFLESIPTDGAGDLEVWELTLILED
jgi:hypothetical protein